MSEKKSTLERYQSFSGISCDINANKLIALLDENINSGKGDKKWHAYFAQKRAQQAKLGNDNLHFIGNQTNILYEYFADCGDQDAQALLYKIEQECC